MLWLIPPAIALVWLVFRNVFFYRSIKAELNVGKVFEGFPMVLFVACCAFMCGAILTVTIAEGTSTESGQSHAKKTFSLENDTQIISLVGTEEESGQFVIGTYGSVGLIWEEKEPQYYIYAVETKSGYEIERVPIADCSLQFATGNPHIEEYGFEYNTWFLRNITFFPLGTTYILYVPANAAIADFNIGWDGK